MSHAKEKDITQKDDERPEPAQVTAFLRNLAERAERDPNLAATLAESLSESGLLASTNAPHSRSRTRADSTRAARAETEAAERANTQAPRATPLDPFVVYRAEGEAGLRAALVALDLDGLRAIVKGRRLDPARVSARWTARERVITLILDQVKARLNHGRAFERV